MPETTKTFTSARLESGARLAVLGIVVNATLAAVKIAAGILGHCYVLIADGIESTLDIFGSLIIWFGLKVAAEPPDEEHPYGHGKAEPVAAIVVALTVFGAALALAVQSVREIVTPHHAPAPFTLIVLVVVVVIKETLFRKVAHTGDEIGSTAVKTDAWHHRADAITSIAAFIGISIALIGGKIGKHWEPADDWAALFACGLIAFNGWRLLMPALGETMDTAPSEELRSDVARLALAVAGVAEIEKCRIRKTGLEYYVDIHVSVAGDLTVREGHRIAHLVKDAIRTANPAIADVLVHIEPAEPDTTT
ncbi:MAG TPA: cation diffusion facilitator family transporter [Chthoniobacteraceae bacterium]|nr:cation diffusion facilitator family transporter [Chthoniobacteraceae bacterium]